jgi:hypothetical protein
MFQISFMLFKRRIMDSSTPLFALTVGQFSTLIQELKLSHTPVSNQEIVFETDNADINWVSETLKMPLPTIRTKVSRMEMPCKKRGKPMAFSKKEMLEWNEKGRPKSIQEIDFAPVKKLKS